MSPERVRDFLAYLATRREVAASTQNQAFSAILFLFRDVRQIDLGSMEEGVRAKRGPKLPVVLTIADSHPRGQRYAQPRHQSVGHDAANCIVKMVLPGNGVGSFIEDVL